MSPAATGGRRPRVLLASGPVAPLSARAAAIALAEGFAEGAQVAVIGLAEGGPELTRALTEPGGEIEILHTGRVGRRPDLLVVGESPGPDPAPEPAGDPLAGSSAGLGRMLGYALQADVPARVVVDLTGTDSHDAGQGLLAELSAVRDRLADCELIGVVPAGQENDQLLGLRGVTSRKGRALGIPAERMLAVDAELERFAHELAPGSARADGAGAAGGLGFLILALGGRLVTGAALCAELAQLDRALGSADLVVTACDSFDFGSRGGGVVAELARRCEGFEVPLVVVSPVVGVSGREMRTLGIESAHPVDAHGDPSEALTATARRLAEGWTARW